LLLIYTFVLVYDFLFFGVFIQDVQLCLSLGRGIVTVLLVIFVVSLQLTLHSASFLNH